MRETVLSQTSASRQMFEALGKRIDILAHRIDMLSQRIGALGLPTH